jgi:signal peptidase II
LSPAALGWVRAVALACAVLVVDQATKQFAVSSFGDGDVDVGLGFKLVEVRNDGVAFGLLGGGEALVIVITLAALALVAAYYALDPARPGLWIGIGLLAGGALGNLADRLREGSVIDFLDPPAWPAFNVADVAIVAGIATIVLLQMRSEQEDEAGVTGGRRRGTPRPDAES